ncbi:MAG: DMT family transporter [Zoogloeaceae bacterium]|nr:DMT family transporter [Zoogloeaceae bacterium]
MAVHGISVLSASRSARHADFLLLAVALVWGSSYGVTKLALGWYPVLGFLAVRFGLTFVLLLPHVWRLNSATRLATLRAGVPLGLILWLIFLSETYGVAHTSAANAAFLISLCVVLTPFSEWGLLGLRPSRAALGFAALSVSGASMLVGDLRLGFGGGDGLMLLAALLRAIAVCLTKRLAGPQAVDTLALTAVQAGVVSLACLFLALTTGPEMLPRLPASPEFWLACGYLVTFCTLFAFHAQNHAIRRSSPTHVGLLMGTEPVFGALFAAMFLGERLALSGWLGGGLIVVASLWAVRCRCRAATGTGAGVLAPVSGATSSNKMLPSAAGGAGAWPET